MPKSIFVDPDKMRAEGKITFKDIPINTYKKSIQEELDEGNFTKEDHVVQRNVRHSHRLRVGFQLLS